MEENPDIRIIVYGDSNIQARFSNLHDTFPYRLEKYLELHIEKNIEVLNAGVVGFGPDQALIRFLKEMDSYRPDLVIFHIFADNDFGDIIRNRLFELDANGGLIASTHKTRSDEHLNERSGLAPRSRSFLSSLLLVKSARKIMRLLASGSKLRENDAGLIHQYISAQKSEYEVYKKGDPRRISAFADHYDVDIAAFPDSESATAKIKLMEAILKKAKNAATAKGIEFLVLIQPSIIDLTENFRVSYNDLQNYPGYKKTNITHAVDNICEINNIHKINLFDIFLWNKPEDLFFKGGNNHWNNQGQDVAAKETTSYILRNKIIDIENNDTFNIPSYSK